MYHQSNCELDILNRLCLALAETRELPRICQIAHQYLAQFVDFCYFGISLYDPVTRTLRAEYLLDDGIPLDTSLFPPLDMSIEPARGRARAVATHQPEIVTDLPAAVRETQGEVVTVSGTGDERVPLSAVYVPMLVQGEVIGLLEMQSYRPNAYGVQEAALLTPIANQIGLTIENARLFLQIQQYAEELEQRVSERTAELERTARQLKEANEELESFACSVSHDLRAPLRAIGSFSRILSEEYAAELSPQVLHYLGMIESSARRMGQLIDDLLTFSRFTRVPLQKSTVNLAEVVRQALEELRPEQEGRRVEVLIGDLPPCEGDPSLIKQVCVNLLANALKFTRTRDVARIEVGALTAEETASPVYFVRDNGVGFDMRYADKLFTVFQRLHGEEYEGTGVGLAIVQRIVRRHGGRIWAESEVGEGATFYFTLG